MRWSTATTAATTSPPAPSHLSPPPTTSASCPLRRRSRTSRTSLVMRPQPTTSRAVSGSRGAAGAAARCARVLSSWRLFCKLQRHELRTLNPVFWPLQLPRNAGWLAAFKVSPPCARRRGLQRPRSHRGGDERVRRLFNCMRDPPSLTHASLPPADTTMQSPRHLLWSTRRWAAQLRASRSSGTATRTCYSSCLTLLAANAWPPSSAAPLTGHVLPAT